MARDCAIPVADLEEEDEGGSEPEEAPHAVHKRAIEPPTWGPGPATCHLGQEATVRLLGDRINTKIRGLDILVTKEDIIAAILAEIP